MNFTLRVAALAGLSLIGAVETASAQATANAITGADDAFGFTDEDESVGIYDATRARGFDLKPRCSTCSIIMDSP